MTFNALFLSAYSVPISLILSLCLSHCKMLASCAHKCTTPNKHTFTRTERGTYVTSQDCECIAYQTNRQTGLFAQLSTNVRNVRQLRQLLLLYNLNILSTVRLICSSFSMTRSLLIYIERYVYSINIDNNTNYQYYYIIRYVITLLTTTHKPRLTRQYSTFFIELIAFVLCCEHLKYVNISFSFQHYVRLLICSCRRFSFLLPWNQAPDIFVWHLSSIETKSYIYTNSSQ